MSNIEEALVQKLRVNKPAFLQEPVFGHLTLVALNVPPLGSQFLVVVLQMFSFWSSV